MTRQTVTSSRFSLLMALLLVLATAVVFWPLPGYEFITLDDGVHVYDNPYLLPVTFHNVLGFWRQPYMGLYVPLTYTVWALIAWAAPFLSTSLPDDAVFDAGLFHCLNLCLHLLNVLVAFCLLRFLLDRAMRRQQEALSEATRGQIIMAAAGGALVFAVHPLQVEAVAWVSGLKDVLCGLLALVAVWQYLSYAGAKMHETSGVGGKLGQYYGLRYGLATTAFGLALLAKPIAVVIPFVAWILDVWVLQRPWRDSARALLGWMVVAVVWSILTKWVQPDTMLSFIPSFWMRPFIAGDAVTFYVSKLLLPLQLGPHYGRTPTAVLADNWIYVTGSLPWVAGLWLWWQRRRAPWLVVAAGVFIVSFLPVTGLLPFAFQAFSTVADRYVYLAMLGPAWALAWGLTRLKQRKVVVIVCLTLWLGLGGRSAVQTHYWQDTVTLFKHVLRLNPASYLAFTNLGHAFTAQQQFAEAKVYYTQALELKPDYAEAHAGLSAVLSHQGHLAEAIDHGTTALQLDPHMVDGYINLGRILGQQGETVAAMTHYTTALRLQPDSAKVHVAMALDLARQNKFTEATVHYAEALRLRPGWSIASNNFGELLVKQGKLVEALRQFAQAAHARPVLPEASYNLGLTAVKLGRIPVAIEAYRQACRRRPGWPPPANNLAWLLLTQDKPSRHDIAEAIQVVEAANQATHYQEARVLHTLAVAYAVAGRWSGAIHTAQQALTSARAMGDTALEEQIRQRLQSFQSHQGDTNTPRQ